MTVASVRKSSVTSSISDFDHNREKLISILLGFTKGDGLYETAIPGLTLHRLTTTHQLFHTFYAPSFTVVAQGARRAVLMDESFDYEEGHSLVTSVDLPVVSQVTRAAPDSPYLCLSLRIDPHTIGELISEMSLPIPEAVPDRRAMAVRRLSSELLGTVVRLADLLHTPEDIPMLAPLFEKEILYRLLTGDEGPLLRHMVKAGSQSHQVVRAIQWLRAHYAEHLAIDDLAHKVGMSTSALHHHFKTMTGMSPLHYQKRLRLHEARRLMLTELMDAASAGHQVGYASPSQFSREYRRLFGASPSRNIAALTRPSSK